MPPILGNPKVTGATVEAACRALNTHGAAIV